MFKVTEYAALNKSALRCNYLMDVSGKSLEIDFLKALSVIVS